MAIEAISALPAALPQRSLVLPWAVAASVALHGGLLVAHFGGIDGGQPVATPSALYATLQPVPAVVAETPSPPTIPTAAVASAAQPPTAAIEPPPSSLSPARATKLRGSATPSGDALAIPRVPAQPLADRNRLGDLYARQLVEFPIEVDRPARMLDPIVARYPTAALAQGREDSVAVWVVVSVDGTAEEVQVLDGSPEFAAEVVATINAAKFEPAQNRHYRIRFPLALEFEFRADAAVATATAR